MVEKLHLKGSNIEPAPLSCGMNSRGGGLFMPIGLVGAVSTDKRCGLLDVRSATCQMSGHVLWNNLHFVRSHRMRSMCGIVDDPQSKFKRTQM